MVLFFQSVCFTYGYIYIHINKNIRGDGLEEKVTVKRYLGDKPSSYRVIGFLVTRTRPNIFTGEMEIYMDCRVSKKDEPLDITPFLDRIEQVHL